MGTYAYCTNCRVVARYEARRGQRIADQKCKICKAGPGTLLRQGSRKHLAHATSTSSTTFTPPEG